MATKNSNIEGWQNRFRRSFITLGSLLLISIVNTDHSMVLFLYCRRRCHNILVPPHGADAHASRSCADAASGVCDNESQKTDEALRVASA